MTVEEAVEKAAREAAAIMAERGRSGFYGEIGVTFNAGEVVIVKITETVKAV
jgi:hypothetical protein